MPHYTVWQACPADSLTVWLPWKPLAGHLQHALIAPLDAIQAHRIARNIRQALPGHLIAVRPAGAGQPLWPDSMVDHYDLPPYV